MNKATMLQCLQDAGCETDFVARFLYALDHGGKAELLRLLACQRCQLLAQLHTEQKKLECLDFLKYYLQGQVDKFKF